MNSLIAAIALIASSVTGAMTPPPAVSEPGAAALAITPAPDGRIATTAWVNGQGPFQFLIDTGASHSALSPRLVAQLQLQEIGRTQVVGVTGVLDAPMVRVASLATGSLRMRDFNAPVVGPGALGEADGMIAAADISSLRVTFDFVAQTVSIEDPDLRLDRKLRKERLPVTFEAGSIVRTAAIVAGVPAVAILDTGSDYTLINQPLLEALKARGHAEEGLPAAMSSAAPAMASGIIVPLPVMELGEIELLRFAVLATPDLQVLERWGLSDRPTVIIGMNVLRALNTLTIDYTRKQVFFSYQASASTNVDKIKFGGVNPRRLH